MIVLPPVDDEQLTYNANFVYYWNHVGLELNKLTHSLLGPQRGPPISSRVLGILHLAIHDAYFAIEGSCKTYLTDTLPSPANSSDPKMAVAGAAITVLEAFYAFRNISSEFSTDTARQLDDYLKSSIDKFLGMKVRSEDYVFGTEVGKAMLAALIRPGEPGGNQGSYKPKNGRYGFDDDPTNPVKLVPLNPNNSEGPKRAIHVYDSPFYGTTAKRFAVQEEHIIADPPVGFGTDDVQEYCEAIKDVIRMGGAPSLNSTLRRPYQTANGYFWAYDASNLIGTPPRLYNLILRKIAWNKKPADSLKADAEFVRLFALVNTALTDAGILCWHEKYFFEFWRPLSGIRKEGPPLGNPFWLTLGAPETNTNQIPFKPPFPAYPSGHATFGAAAFQTMRRYYKKRDGLKFANDEPDDIGFEFVSDELNGISRDLQQPYEPQTPITDQPGIVRTRVPRSFCSLWEAIFENAISRVFLGVHWRFDAFATKDVLGSPPLEPDGTTAYKKPADIRYVTQGKRKDRPGMLFPSGGVPLGISIANDIFDSGLKPASSSVQPSVNVETKGKSATT